MNDRSKQDKGTITISNPTAEEGEDELYEEGVLIKVVDYCATRLVLCK